MTIMEKRALALILCTSAGAQAQPDILAGPLEYGGHTYYLLEDSTVWSAVASFGGQDRWG
jgi:hypothetical protein